MTLKQLIALVFTMLALAACGGNDTTATIDNNPAAISSTVDTDQVEQSLTRPDDPTIQIPCCCNCEYILNNCENNGWKPTGLCNYCATGNCYDGCNNCE
jgi:hypothetical protein